MDLWGHQTCLSRLPGPVEQIGDHDCHRISHLLLPDMHSLKARKDEVAIETKLEMLWPATAEQLVGRVAFYILPLCSSAHPATSVSFNRSGDNYCLYVFDRSFHSMFQSAATILFHMLALESQARTQLG